MGPGSDCHPPRDGRLANETSQELFRGQEVGLDPFCYRYSNVEHLIDVCLRECKINLYANFERMTIEQECVILF